MFRTLKKIKLHRLFHFFFLKFSVHCAGEEKSGFISNWPGSLCLHVVKQKTTANFGKERDSIRQRRMYSQDFFCYGTQEPQLNKLNHEIQLTGMFNLVAEKLGWLQISWDLGSKQGYLSLATFLHSASVGPRVSVFPPADERWWSAGEAGCLQASGLPLLILWAKRKSFVPLKPSIPKLFIAYLLRARPLVKFIFYWGETEDKQIKLMEITMRPNPLSSFSGKITSATTRWSLRVFPTNRYHLTFISYVTNTKPLTALKMKWDHVPKIWTASKSRKRQRTDTPPEPPRGMQSCWHLDVSSVMHT